MWDFHPIQVGGSLSLCSGSSVGEQRTQPSVFGVRAAVTGGGRGRWLTAQLSGPGQHQSNPHPPGAVRVVCTGTGSSRIASSARRRVCGGTGPVPGRPSRRAPALSRLYAAATRRRGDGRAAHRLRRRSRGASHAPILLPHVASAEWVHTLRSSFTPILQSPRAVNVLS